MGDDPNEALKAKYKRQAQLEYEYEITNKMADQAKLNNSIKLKLQSTLNEDEANAINKKYEDEIQTQAKEFVEKEQELYKKEAPIRQMAIKKQILNDMQKESNELYARDVRINAENNDHSTNFLSTTFYVYIEVVKLGDFNVFFKKIDFFISSSCYLII